MATLRDVVVDASDPEALALFWAQLLTSHRVRPHATGSREVVLEPTDEAAPRIWFVAVPDPTPGKNRLHLDVDLGSNDELEELLERGATVHAGPQDHGERWWVLADPEGNLFCAFPPEPDDILA